MQAPCCLLKKFTIHTAVHHNPTLIRSITTLIMQCFVQLRNADLTTKSETSGDRCKIHKYAGRIHLDYHGENAKGIFKDVAARIPQKYSKGRFLFINIWRNISDEPVGWTTTWHYFQKIQKRKFTHS